MPLVELGDRYAGATFSEDMRYRFSFHRRISDDDGIVLAAMLLNPSSADHVKPDPTCTRLMLRVRDYNAAMTFGRPVVKLVVANMYGFRSKTPKALWTVDDPVGEHNDEVVRQILSEATIVVCAWGRIAKPDRVGRFLELVKETESQSKLRALRILRGGTPEHPLYIPLAAPLLAWPV